MGKRKKRKKARVVGPIAPPLVPFARTLERADGRPVTGIKFSMKGEPADNFAAFVRREPADLSTRSVGNWDHLSTAYLNVLTADVKRLSDQIRAAGGNPVENARANAAGINLFTASYLLHSAITLHLHPVRWNDRAACSLIRTAFECAGRAAVIASGTADEVHRWESGNEFSAADCIAAIETELAAAEANAPKAKKVYSWLCNFTHMNYHGALHFYLAQEGGNEDAYAALAYVSWALAVVATKVIGVPLGAKYPDVMPAKLPWD